VQVAVLSMPVLSMHEANWDDPRELLPNGQEIPALRQNMASVRSQDDARVGYMFQRQENQTGKVGQPPYAGKAWLGERTALEQVDTIFCTDTVLLTCMMSHLKITVLLIHRALS